MTKNNIPQPIFHVNKKKLYTIFESRKVGVTKANPKYAEAKLRKTPRKLSTKA